MTGPLIAVGRIGKAHGIKGEVSVEAWTDDPEDRFAADVVLTIDAATAPEGAPAALTVLGSHLHSGRWLVSFAGIADRNAAEALRGARLMLPAGARPAIEDPDEFYDSDLTGLAARSPSGEALGIVADVVHGPAGDYLALLIDGREHLVPFVGAIVPTVDIAGGFVVVDAPEGLFTLHE